MPDDDTFRYRGWPISDGCLKRVFGVLLSYLAGALIICGIFTAVVIVILLFAVLFAGLAGLAG